MVEWLSQNWWVGVAGIVAIIGLLVAIFKSGDKISADNGGAAVKGQNNDVRTREASGRPKL